MIQVSNEFRERMAVDDRNYLIYLDIVLKDGTVLDTLDNSDIWEGGFQIDDGVTASGEFTVGSCIINKMTVTLNNIYDTFSEYDFDGAVVTAYLGLRLPGGNIEKMNKGVYTVDNPQYDGAMITLECLDNMSKFDVDYAEIETTYPAALGTIVKDICDGCGVVLNTTVFDNDDYLVEKRPEDDALTCRQVLADCAQIAGCFGRCDMYGRLEFKWFDQTEGTKKFHDISSLSSFTAGTDDVVITGIEVTEEFAETEEEKKNTVLNGDKGYVLSITGNALIQRGMAETVANYLGQRLIGLRFRPMSAQPLADPTIEAGDIAHVTDHKQNTYQCLITNLSFKPGEYMSVTCDAETPGKNSAKQYSEMTKAVVEARKNAQIQISAYDKTVQQITQLISQGFGMYLTAVQQEDGGKIYYMHDKSTIEESSYTCYHTSTGIIASLDGGTTWAVDKNGNGLFNVLTARGVNADWVNTGRLVAKDVDGNTMFLVDIDTGEVRINAQSISLGSSEVVTQDDLDNLEVGGRQILRGTEAPVLVSTASSSWTDGTFAYGSGGNGTGSIEDVSDSPIASVSRAFVLRDNTTGNKDFQQYSLPIVNGQTYIFSVWVKGTGRLLFRLWYRGANSGQTFLNETVNAAEWTRVTATVTADIPTGTTDRGLLFGVSSVCDEMIFIAPKLEKGNIPTDWTPALEDTASDINNAVAIAEAAQNAIDVSLDVIVGTQTAATGAWTGKAKFSELKDGQQIVYWLPYAGSGNATLNLTLADGITTTGAKNCYYGGTTRLTTHYPAGSAIRLVYRKSALINGSKYEGWWADANYDSGNDRTRYQQPIKCGTTAIVAGNVIVGKNGVYQHLKSGASFDISYQILYAGSAIAASATGTNNYLTTSLAVATTQSLTLTAYKPIYIKGKLSGTTFNPVSTAPLTQVIPTSNDGYHYILLGQASSTTGMYLLPEHPIFMFHNGAFKSFEQIAAEAAVAAENAQNDIDNLQIGGRNLLPDSDRNTLTKVSAPGNRYWSDANSTNVTPSFVNIADPPMVGIKYGTQFVVTDTTIKTGRCLAWYSGGVHVPMIDGETYTLSVYARVISGEGRVRFQIGNGSPYYSSHHDVTASWKQYSYTFTYESSAWDDKGIVLYIGVRSDVTGTVQLCGFKCEKGTRATDWTPAPEDVQDSIDKVQADVNGMTKTVFSPSAPTDMSVLWVDTSQTPPVAKRYNPSTVSWEIIGDTTDIVQRIYSDVYSKIEQTTNSIMTTVGEQTYLKGDVDELVEGVKTEYLQDKERFEYNFTQLTSTLQELSESTEQTFNETVKYIRFIDGSIYIGVEGNPIILKQSNDRISFLENGVEVAYISNRQMYITDLQVINSQTVGTFRWQMEPNESLSLV